MNQIGPNIHIVPLSPDQCKHCSHKPNKSRASFYSLLLKTNDKDIDGDGIANNTTVTVLSSPLTADISVMSPTSCHIFINRQIIQIWQFFSSLVSILPIAEPHITIDL